MKTNSINKSAFNKPKRSSTTVYVGNLSFKRDEKGIHKLFSYYGRVISIDIATIPGTEKSRR